jgi:hypothetical protein
MLLKVRKEKAKGKSAKERVKNQLLKFLHSAESTQLILKHLACIDSSE